MAIETYDSKQVDSNVDSRRPQVELGSILADASCTGSTSNKSADVDLPGLVIADPAKQTGDANVKLSPQELGELKLRAEADRQLTIARDKFYEIANGGLHSNDVKAAQLSSDQLLQFVKGPEFRNWVASEKAAGNEVFWPTDVDKTMSSGDTFTYFFKWREDHHKFSPEQLQIISNAIKHLDPQAKSTTPEDALKLWQSKEKGGQGIGLLDFWNKIYWPSQKGMTMAEKVAETKDFSKTFSDKIYPLVPEINKAIEDAGAHVVILSNGDQEIAKAIAPEFGVKPENVIGATTLVDPHGFLTGAPQNYEMFDKTWSQLPQPGKEMNFHNWLDANKQRFGWNQLDEGRVLLAGYNGDSAAADGGMMVFSKEKGIADFMVDTPGEPSRIAQFYSLANQFGGTKGEFVTLHRQPSSFDLSNYKW